jgi:hypothetical protein
MSKRQPEQVVLKSLQIEKGDQAKDDRARACGS